jgi:cystathionine gamma-synthase
VPPIHLSANFVFESAGVCGKYDYTRSGNPTRDQFAEAIAELEGGCGGIVTSSGMSAISVVTQLLGAGDTLMAPHDGYGGSYRLFNADAKRVGYEVCYVDQASEASLEASLQAARESKPRIVWIETPSNPFLRITDIRKWTDVAREVGAVSVVDNTFLSPAGQRPLELGADVVVHSATKFINGHSDVVAGAIVAKDATLLEELAWWANCLGVTGAPFDSYLGLRGLRTLFARTEVSEGNALRIVQALSNQELVTGLYHPSIPGHTGHEVAQRQQDRWGSLVSLELRGGRPVVDAFLVELEHFTLAESLGGVESLVTHPATMTHASMDEAGQRKAGIHGGLVRLSVGIEDGDDLVHDLEQALAKAAEVACVAV